MKRFLPLMLVAIGLLAMLVYSQQRPVALVVSGFIKADEIRVGSRVGGRVARVLVAEGQEVSQGDSLVELEPFDLKERLAEAEHVLARVDAVFQKITSGYRSEEIAETAARRDRAAAQLEKLKNGPRPQEIKAADAELRLAIAERNLATTTYQRVEALFGKQAADQSDLDAALTKLSVAEETVNAKQATVDLLNEGTRSEDLAQAVAAVDEAQQQLNLRQNGYRSEEISEAKAARDAAAAAVDAIRTQLRELIITAPVAAVVEAIDLQPGDLVAANAPSISLIDRHRLWVRAYVPENRLNLKIGQQVTVRVDSFPNRRFEGEVIFVAREAEFTPGNVQTPEERSKQVFRIKVLLSSGHEVLRPGMAADVQLDAGDES